MADRLVVVGDSLLDVDLDGQAHRLSPDSPAPVLDDLVEHPRPGGAALAAALAATDGRDVVLVTALADDVDGEHLHRLLNAAGVEVVALPLSGRTPVKTRVRAGGQPLVRLDRGGEGEPGPLTAAARAALQGASAVLVSDYGRGLTSVADLRDVLTDVARTTPVVWDPHPRGAEPVPGVRLVTPNQSEAGAVDGSLAAVGDRAQRLVAQWRAHAVVVTMGGRGALLSRGEPSPAVIPAPPVSATDTCGAGDRFAATAAGALADGQLTPEAVQAAVLAASRFVAAGAASAFARRTPLERDDDRLEPSVSELDRVRASGGTVVATGGCFDLLHAGHVATLEAARALGDCLVVCLNSDASVRRLKGPSRPLVPATDRARVLAALAPVDAVVVFDEDTPETVLAQLRPDVWVKGGDYAGTELPEAALLRSWGGQSVVLPYLTGRSTTALVASAATRTA